MLWPIKVDLISKKRTCKQNLIRLNSFNSGKIDFTLLIEVIILYVEPIIINIR